MIFKETLTANIWFDMKVIQNALTKICIFLQHIDFMVILRFNRLKKIILDEKECLLFFNKISTEYNNYPTYVMNSELGNNRGQGLEILDAVKQKVLQEKYQNGALCGKIFDNLLVQNYITNPLLIDKKNKFDFRIYMLVASVNPLIVFYHDGFISVSQEAYNVKI